MTNERKIGWLFAVGLWGVVVALATTGCPRVHGESPMPRVDTVILPAPPAPPAPPPATTPTLGAGQTYLVRASVACVVICSPDGVCEVCPRKGPLTLDATLWPATTPTLNDLTEPYLYLIRPKTTGTCELLITPAGGALIRQTLIVGTPPSPPPGPTDPLTAALQAAYASETDAAKADKVSRLIEDCLSVPAIKSSGKVTTLLQLHDTMHTAADLQVGVGGLPILRKAMSTYIAGKLPSTDGPLTETTWAAATAAYADVAKALKGVH